jgi:hypothetical protein
MCYVPYHCHPLRSPVSCAVLHVRHVLHVHVLHALCTMLHVRLEEARGLRHQLSLNEALLGVTSLMRLCSYHCHALCSM